MTNDPLLLDQHRRPFFDFSRARFNVMDFHVLSEGEVRDQAFEKT